MSLSVKENPFRLQGSLQAAIPFPGAGALEAAIARISGLSRLEKLYYEVPPALDTDQFLHYVLDLFHIGYEVLPDELALVPEKGGAILVANHPFGALEGVIMAALLRKVRPDVRIMANYFLKRVPELAELFIAVDPFGGPKATSRNSQPLREAVRWVRNGGLLVIFPAGEVSHLQLQQGGVVDPEWSATVGRLARLTEAPVVPAYIHGANGPFFQLVGMIHPRLRTLLLPRELFNKQGRSVSIRIGQPITPAKVRGYPDDLALTHYLRGRTYALRTLVEIRGVDDRGEAMAPRREMNEATPMAPPVPAGLLQAEVEALPPQQCLECAGTMSVHYAEAGQIPWILQEIGRLREVTFRAVGEGTGNASDIDLYDAYYIHLFVWNGETKEIIGAYRLGLADEILQRYGKRGLYTQSLFKYGTRLLRELGPAIELGRSFVRAEYQKSYGPLLMLWKGIGRFVAAHPRYKVLFGPVSISNDYESTSRQLLVEFLRANNYLPDLARHVKPRRPFRSGRKARLDTRWVAHTDLEEISDLLSRIEPDGKGVPILLKQYLKLGGRLLGFNVDNQFNEALDGLIMVDLSESDPKVLQRYMGRAEAERFLARHRTQAAV